MINHNFDSIGQHFRDDFIDHVIERNQAKISHASRVTLLGIYSQLSDDLQKKLHKEIS